ncbi:STAS-like domain-containing protein [Enterococcus dongliensis]|uniref:STAS-like domain-containing protein n=1 Tax=Enterococcus dongliensis TaxID=2559925 RepID=UPI00288C7521|nr:STAS-like domain-containing protein [Enterococcus dongliensis]MDT2703675.1 STAS-like domain-containing protein [Enterococcus dongliensis]
MEERIYINKLIDSDLAVSSEKASIVFSKIQENMKANTTTILDFSGIKSLTTAFLNVAIGELYRYEKKETLNQYISIDVDTLSKLQFNKVKLVMDNSRTKYNSDLKKKIDEVTLHGETD